MGSLVFGHTVGYQLERGEGKRVRSRCGDKIRISHLQRFALFLCLKPYPIFAELISLPQKDTKLEKRRRALANKQNTKAVKVHFHLNPQNTIDHRPKEPTSSTSLSPHNFASTTTSSPPSPKNSPNNLTTFLAHPILF